jgi:class 3 adenylate cyclase/tetratricopeptide (TPR) repeat protein
MTAVRKWLEAIGLAQYVEAFEANKIDMDLLRQVDDQILKDIGVSAAGDRLRIRNAIAKIVTAPIAEVNLSPTPKHETIAASAERRQLTVMFCDLVGSTALSARLDPEDLRSIITAYHCCCTELVERNGGFVAKYMGDGVLAYFGYPQAHEHDAERAVRVGLNLAETIPKLATNAGSPLQARVGIATGLVVVGDLIGAGAAQEQAVVGETPNLAARLQALADPGAVVIASSTRLLTGGLFEYRDLGTVALKGFAENVPAWQVLGAGTTESRFEALRTVTTPLIGRDEEIDLLLRRWEQAKRGEGCVVLISGEPGIGKSRMAQTIVERLSSESHTRLRSFCSPHHQDSALYPTITRLERAAGFRREDTDAQRLNKLETVLGQATNDLGDAVPLLAALLSIPTGGRYPPLNLSPHKQKERTLHALLAQVKDLAARQPVLIVWEDVHWIDPTSRELLDLIVERVPSLPVLLIVTYRPEFVSPWVGRSQVTLITLNRLSPRRCAEIIARVTEGKSLPEDVSGQIINRTDGVPLFVEELTKTVIESGALTDAGDRYIALRPLPPLAIPTTLSASLLARLDRLVATREVAQIGAALGRHFSYELISAVAAMPQQQLDDALAQLVRAELVFRRGTLPDVEYTFKHALVQDAAYSTLLRNRRQQLHGRITATLEGQFPEIVTAQPQLLAQHCDEAGLAEKSVGYRLAAGRQAVARSAMTEAAAQLGKGLELLSSLPDNAWRWQQELDLLLALAQALIAAKGYASPPVGEAFARAGALAERLNRTDYVVPLLYGQCLFHHVRLELSLALPLAQQMEQIGEARNDAPARLLGQVRHGIVRFLLGEFTFARALFEQCDGLNDPAIRATYAALTPTDQYDVAIVWLATTLTTLGYVDQGRSRLNEALRATRERRHAHTLALVLVNAARIQLAIRSPDAAQRYAEEALAISKEQGFALYLGWGSTYRGEALISLGRAQEGLTLIADGLAMCRATEAALWSPSILAALAEAYSRVGQPIEGLNCLAESVQIVETTGERCSEAEIYRLRGDLLRATGDDAAAESSYHKAIAVAEHQNAKLFELRAAISLARLWRDQGRRTEARDLLAPIYGWFAEGLDTPVLQDAKALLDQLA